MDLGKVDKPLRIFVMIFSGFPNFLLLRYWMFLDVFCENLRLHQSSELHGSNVAVPGIGG